MRWLAALLGSLWLTAAAAQAPVEGESIRLADAPAALVSVGLGGGFPGYQTVAPWAAIQSGHFGFQVKASWTAAGPFFGAQLRGYPPLSSPVPVYLGVGAGVYGSSVAYHAALGAHVPLGVNLRLDVEGGAALVPLLADRAVVPHVSLGVSYAFPVDLAGQPTPTARGSDAASASTCGERTPDEAGLRRAFERTLHEFLTSATATYGSLYRELQYSYSVTSLDYGPAAGSVTIAYSGSVREIATGTVHDASGSASASFRWNGCGWVNTGVNY